jgi:pimeloyl-ACP methyl ester carboxylesterase
VTPKTHYARTGGVSIAYQVVGEGPLDLVYVPGWISNIEMMWTDPSYARLLTRFAKFSRLILFDKRGTGLSDRVANDQLPTLEERMDDVRVRSRGAIRLFRRQLDEHSVRGDISAANDRAGVVRELREVVPPGRWVLARSRARASTPSGLAALSAA